MNNNPFPQPICEQIWNSKYRLITPNTHIKNDESVQDTWRRIANACATDFNTDQIDGKRRDQFYEALEDFKFLPAGRITAGAGSGRNVTLFNCYVMGTIPDDMSGIFQMLKEAALTMQQGGGIGYDFSPLRPKDAPVKGVDADASGPLSFMDVWDSMCRTIMSAGSRRGAMMATMMCDHPDIEDFITAKRESTRLRMFNLSVMATDAFMHAVKNDLDWDLCHTITPLDLVINDRTNIKGQRADGKYVYKTVRAKDLWNLMMESTYEYAEPGVLFIDRINGKNNLWYDETISSTNPCGEQPLPPYGACLLGSINLVKFIDSPFAPNSSINMIRLEKTVKAAVRMLDSVIDISLFPLPEQHEEAVRKRRMGLGMTGLADALFMLNLTYGSNIAATFAENIMKTITLTAYRESIKMAKEFGPCPVTSTEEQRREFCKSGFMKDMPTDIIQGVLEHGIRNALLTSVAPTGTISLYAGNVSSGIEPIFAKEYTRKVLQKDGVTRLEEKVEDYAVKLYNEYRENNYWDKEPNPKYLVTAQTISPIDHVMMQAAVQKWTDSSISKTTNCPEDISFEDFQEVYMEAYARGCKGCTTYRPNDVTGSVLSVEKPVEPESTGTSTESVPVQTQYTTVPMARESVLDGQTYKIKWDGSNVYVTINNEIDDEGKMIPFEIFINSKDTGHYQWTVALTRMISGVFRRGGDISFVSEELKNVFDPNGGAWMKGKYIPSFIALLGQTIEQHLTDIGYSEEKPEEKINADSIKFNEDNHPVGTKIQCFKCKGFNVYIASGCPVCSDCGHSKCG